MAKKFTVSNPQDLVNDSNAISLASEVLFARFDEFLETKEPELFKSSFLGAVILNSFAIELSFKAIHATLNLGKFPSGHKLKELYNELPSVVKKEIGSRFSASTNGECLDKFLESHNTSFQDWRYVAESKNDDLLFNFGHCRKLLEILQS